MDWATFISQLALLGAVQGGLAWLVKTLISHQLVRELETLKHGLAAEADQNRVRFGKLHERRAEIIENLYKRIAHILGMIRLCGENSEDVAKTAQDLQRDMIDMAYYFNQHALYFDDGLKAKFGRVFMDGLSQPMTIMSMLGAIELYLEKIDERQRKMGAKDPKIDLRAPIIARLKEQIPQMTEIAAELEREFQIILGVRKR